MSNNADTLLREFADEWGIRFEVEEPGYYELVNNSDKCLSDLNALLDKLMPTELIKTQQEYIEFLGKELGDAAVFQHIHNIHASNDVVNRGVWFRETIKRLDDEFRSRMKGTKL